LRLKLVRFLADLTDSGRLFHTVGPATEKARSPNLVFSVEQCSLGCWQSEDIDVLGCCLLVERNSNNVNIHTSILQRNAEV